MKNNLSILKNINILYAEDEDDLREVTSNILQNFTKKQFIAANGEEGLELFKKYEEEIDLIITDVNMPILNGLDMVKEIKKININIPIIVATAFSNKEYLLEAIDIGVDKYVLKPIDISKLLIAMSQSLGYHELKELYTDTLTHLPNRNKLKKDLETHKNDLMALLDIDDFSTINDLFGEHNGDKILSSIAISLKNFFNENLYKVYRIEADKFAVVAKSNDIQTDDIYKLCENFANKIEENAVLIDDNEININITVGIAKGDGLRAFKFSQRVINYARSKFQRIMVYNDTYNIQQSFEENIKWVNQLKEGFRDRLFHAYFQGIVDTHTKEIYKYEALIRYIDKNGNSIPPYLFLDVAKKTKQYPNIIKIILEDSFHLIKTKNKKVSINISFYDISNENTLEYIYSVLEENKEYSHMLEFEILESEEISDFSEVSIFIKKIKEYNCVIGIDDFGAGYSNFNLITLLNIDFVKIDGSLIKNINTSKEFIVIVNTIINFAKELNVKTVAEFVSSEEIYDTVKGLGVDYCQGFLFSQPSPYNAIPKD